VLTEAIAKLTAAATANFEGLGIVVLSAHRIAVIVRAEADAGHPALTLTGMDPGGAHGNGPTAGGLSRAV